jgi:hypothetical protein
MFKEFLYFFKKYVLSGLSFINRQLLIMDGHGSHVTLEAISQAKEINLDIITLPSHTSHVLQPLDVSCLKPFKITFRKVKDVIMFKNNHMEPDKITLVGWVHQALE